jgi:RNA polymerase primary sigma factor
MSENLIANTSIRKLVDKGKLRGYVTYEEMNAELPDEAVSPDGLDSLLMSLDELGIELLDESEVKQREEFAADGNREDEAASPGTKKAKIDLEV